MKHIHEDDFTEVLEGVSYKNLAASDQVQAARARARLMNLSSSFETTPGEPPEDSAFLFSSKRNSSVINYLTRPKSGNPLAHISHAPAGIGKTTSTIQSISEKILMNDIQIVHYVINHKLADETRSAYLENGVPKEEIVIWKGQGHEDMCRKYKTVRKYQAMGLPAKKLCEDCEFRDTCEFQKIRKRMGTANRAPSVVIAPVAYLQSGGMPKRILEDGTDLVIIDESVHQTMIDHGKLALGKLGRAWNSAYDASDAEEDTRARMHEISMAIAHRITTSDVLSGLVRSEKEAEFMAGEIQEIINLRNAELGAFVDMNSDDLPAEMGRKKVPEYVQEELKIWKTLHKQLMEFHLPESRKTAWIMRRDTGPHTFIDYVDRVRFPHPGAPVLLLDASADKSIYTALFGATHEIDYTSYKRPSDTLERTLISGRSFSKSSLLTEYPDPKYKDREDARIRRVEDANRVLTRILEREKGRRILLISNLDVIKAIRDPGHQLGRDLDLEDVETAHFGSLRGQNRFQNFDTVIILGKMELSSDVSKRMALGLSDDPKSVIEDDGERDKIRIDVQLKNGRKGIARSSRFRNPDLQRVLTQSREEEIVQCEQRLRPARRTDEDLRSYIIGDVIPEGYAFDRVFRVQDFRENKVTDLIEGEGDVCLSVAGYMQAHGCRQPPAKEAIDRRDLTGWTTCAVKRKGAKGRPLIVYVGPHATDPEAAAIDHAASVKEWDRTALVATLK